ncbi:PREDICTED: TELO2-interacting protein 1 homolog [Priapulus caudatus]|uniref:TELO2-interacting protein 1 homolog n=1 Tax=Priapulus caudatus TaxID=37621 RepID=A0ABM1EU44_PRICU|nr:PREDICTED: TELO2-interacting protein 1 homolog [Priapulus caudatus]
MDGESERDARISLAFGELRPLCVRVSQHATVESLAALKCKLHTVNSALSDLQEYVLFPLSLILKKGTSQDDVVQLTVECISKTLGCGEVSEWYMFRDVFVQLCLIFGSPDEKGGTEGREKSEELKLATIACLKVLITNSTVGILERLYCCAFLPALGHAIFMLLRVCEKESSRQLQLEALELLATLLQCQCQEGSSSMHQQMGDCFASFLPGISITLTNLATGDICQGHKVTMLSVSTWQKLVTMVMGDKQLTLAAVKDIGDECTAPLDHLKVLRDKAWTVAAAEKLQVLVQRLAGLVSHSSWKVRLALGAWADALLTHCTGSLSSSVPFIVETLVALSGDDYDQVARSGRESLARFSERCSGDDAKPLVNILQENFYSLCSSLPRMMRVSGDDVRLSTLRVLTGYIRLLRSQIVHLLASLPHLHRLSIALLQTLELDCSGATITEQTPGTGSGNVIKEKEVQTQTKARKTFSSFSNEKIYMEIMLACRLLGHYGDVDILVDHFMDLFRDSAIHRKQVILILSNVMLGVSGRGLEAEQRQSATQELSQQALVGELEVEKCSVGSEDRSRLCALIRSLVEEFVQNEHWHLPTSIYTRRVCDEQHASDRLMLLKNHPLVAGDDTSLKDVNSNILFVCLLLEALQAFSQVLEEDFRVLLMTCLYPVMEKVGDDTALVSQTAYLTLVEVASNCGYSSVGSLIHSNTDYLVNSISLRLRHLWLNPRAPLVLQVMLQYGDASILPLVEHTVKEIFSNLDVYHSYKGLPFLKVLIALVTAILRWYPPPTGSHDGDAKNDARGSDGAGCESLRSYLLEYQRLKKEAEDLQSEDHLPEDIEWETEMGADAENAAGQDEQSEEAEEGKPPPPLHVKLVVEVMERCVHLLGAPDMSQKLLVMDIVQNAALALKDREDDLLPMIHKVWSPLVLRFSDKELPVLRQAFMTLCCIADCCGDFLRQRTVAEVWKRLADFLLQQSKLSCCCRPDYEYTLVFKLQVALLQRVGRLCVQLQVNEKECDDIVKACIPYLHSGQPIALQQAAMVALQHLIGIEPDVVWLHLIATYSPVKELASPHPCFPPIKVYDGNTDVGPYTANVMTLMKLLDTS